jgi:hypothetical protein
MFLESRLVDSRCRAGSVRYVPHTPLLINKENSPNEKPLSEKTLTSERNEK